MGLELLGRVVRQSQTGKAEVSTIGKTVVNKELKIRVRQQEVIAGLGLRALSGVDLQNLMDEAVRQVAGTLEMEYCKVLELLPGGDSLLLKAGVGWKEGLVGVGVVGTDRNSQAGYTLRSREPVIVKDLRSEDRFRGPSLLVEHGVVSGMSVIIHGRKGPYGVLGTHTTSRLIFTRDDVHFIQAVANILGEAVERVRSEEALRLAHDDLERRVQERTAELLAVNEELESFSYSVSHDLRAPLRSIDGFSGALLDDFGEQMGETERAYVERIRNSTKRMSALIDSLLRLSKISNREARPHEVDVTALARSVLKELQADDDESGVVVTIEENLTARADQQLLRIVLVNLLGNALKFTRDRATPHIEVRCEVQGGEKVFSVRDNGAGFSMEYADKLFSPFQRLHHQSEFEGSGVGLATAQRIIRKHGGRIWGESEEGNGAVFYFVLESQPA